MKNDEERRRAQNRSLISRMRNGESLMPQRNPFPPRGIIKKDPKEIARLYGQCTCEIELGYDANGSPITYCTLCQSEV